MTRALVAATAALVFVVLGTANAGGYRYGVSDQAFHVPAFAHKIDPALFPRDATLLAAQTSRTLGYDIFVPFARTVEDLPGLFLILYVAGMIGFAVAATLIVRALGGSSWAVAGAMALLTLRHRISRTGANSLEGYMNPRMLAFAVGLGSVAAILKRRPAVALALTAVAAIIHPTTGLWFIAVAGVAALALWKRRSMWAVLATAGVTAIAWLVIAAPRMDGAWRAVLDEKDYLFPLEWPAYAWIFNLLYAAVLLAIYRRRRALGRLAPGEQAMIAGLMALLAGFIVSLPLTVMNIAPVIQLQVNRVFWVMDAVAVIYLAWWLLDDVVARRGARWRLAAVVLIVALSVSRGAYILAVETHRPLVQATLPATDWNGILEWIRHQPKDWQVLSSPEHASRYGTSVRVGALHDTVLEQSKDSSTAMYDRAIAMRVADRREALSGFDSMHEEQLRALARRFDAQVAIVERSRQLKLPVLFQNSGFIVHDLR